MYGEKDNRIIIDQALCCSWPLFQHVLERNLPIFQANFSETVETKEFCVVIHIFSTMFSRIFATRVLVRAFANTHNGGLHTKRFVGGSQLTKIRCFSARGVAVEDDLDVTLNNAVDAPFAEYEEPPEVLEKDSHAISQSLVEEVSESWESCQHAVSLRVFSNAFVPTIKKVDPANFKDPKFLSTSNPRWVKAGLSQKVIDVLSEKGITCFTPVQGEAFDPVVAGRDMIGRSRTGTGKTLAFGMPSLTRLVNLLEEKGYRDERGRMARGRPVSMLVLCPTRELARQVQEELSAIARPLGLYSDVFHGGVSYEPQVRAFKCG